MSNLGVDPKKVIQFEDPDEPPPRYGIIPDRPEELNKVCQSINWKSKNMNMMTVFFPKAFGIKFLRSLKKMIR